MPSTSDTARYVWRQSSETDPECHSLIADGVLCRWWGDAKQEPQGAHLIRAIPSLISALEAIEHEADKNDPDAGRIQSLAKDALRAAVPDAD